MSPRRSSKSPAFAVPVIAPRAAASLRRRLIAWYRRAARDLPWRRTRDPYAIWVSEIMLQQTQVATATPYYRQFLRRFPSVHRLAAAPRDAVLAAWAGLGYYRRARMLHDAAALVVRERGGRVPGDPTVFSRLPGVGRYTTGAVQSIAFGHPLPVLDGNVARVFSRMFGLPLSVRDPAGAKALWALAEALVPMRDPGDWNQALMELGATICLPRAPRCGACPARRTCVARSEGRVDELPPPGPRPATVFLRRAIAVLRWRGAILVERRTGALLDGLWEPPGVELHVGEPAGPGLAARLRALGVRARPRDSGRRLRHTITHRRIEVEVWEGALSARVRARPNLRLVTVGGARLGLSALARRALESSADTPMGEPGARRRRGGPRARGPAGGSKPGKNNRQVL